MAFSMQPPPPITIAQRRTFQQPKFYCSKEIYKSKWIPFKLKWLPEDSPEENQKGTNINKKTINLREQNE